MKNNSLYFTSEEAKTEDHAKFYASEELVFNVTEDILILMEDKSVSKQQLASMMGKTKAYISQLLGGSRNMTIKTLSDICFALKVKPQLSLQKTNIMLRKDVGRIQLKEIYWHAHESGFQETPPASVIKGAHGSKRNAIDSKSKDLWSEAV